ncbi:MAG: TolC family protein [Candidatus Kapabacteria bacterium]|nr:TolC family protein [Candidatus Kapabacteria bacterium]
MRRHTLALLAFAVAVLLAPFMMHAQRLGMSDAVREAMQKNFRLTITRLDSAAASARERMGASGLYPSLDVAANGLTGENNISQRTASGVNIDRAGAGFTNMNANATLQWTLFDGFRMVAIDEQMSRMADAQREAARGAYARVIADVMTRYAAVVASEHALDGGKAALGLAERRLDLARRRLQVGQASQVSVSQAEIDRNAVASLLERQRTSLRVARTALAVLIARDPADTFAVDTGLAMPQLDDAAVLEAAMLERNPELLAAEQQVLAARAEERQASASLWPRIDAVGGYGMTNNSTEAGFILENRTTGWNAGLQMRFNLFRGFADQQAGELARVETLRRKAEIDDLRLRMRGELAATIERSSTGERLLLLERSTLAAARANAEVVLESYRQGLVSDLDVRQAQQSLVEITTRIAQLEFEVYSSGIEALRLAGRLVR